MNNLTIALNNVHQFVDKYPTIIAQRRAIKAAGQRFATVDELENRKGAIIGHAGEISLASIHEEIYDGQPQWLKDAAQDEADEEARHNDKKEFSQVINPK